MKSLDAILDNIQQNNFLIIGRAGIDIYPDPPGTKTENAKKFVTHLGGSSANIGVALTKLGGKCHLLTCVSEDALGRLAINQLNHYGVDTSLVRYVKGESRISFAIVETTIKDHQSIIYRNNAADLEMSKEDINKFDYKKFSSIIVTGTSLAAEPSRSATLEALNTAKKNNLAIILDIDYRPYTWSSLQEASKTYLKAAEICDIVIGNDDEFAVMAENYNDGIKLAEKLSKSTASIVIYKMGAKGSITFTVNEKIKTGIFQVDALKPTGAGDAFMGVFISSLLNKKSIKDSVIDGSASAAIVVTKVGCSPAMPSKEELELFLKKNMITNFKDN